MMIKINVIVFNFFQTSMKKLL